MPFAKGLIFGLTVCACLIAPAGAAAWERTDSHGVGPDRQGHGIQLHAEHHGQGRPLLLIHGFGSNTYCWRHLVSTLAASNHVIAIDLKGFGSSPKPWDDGYTAQDQVALVKQFLIQENLEDVILIGHSYGGGIALAVAIDDMVEGTHRVTGLVLIDSAAYPQSLPRFMRQLRIPIVGSLGVRLVPPKWQVRNVLGVSYWCRERIGADQIAAYAAPIRAPGGRHALVKTAKNIFPSNLDDLTRQYQDIDLPTLIIWGRHDKIVPLSLGHRLHEAIPNSSLVVVEDCGHIPHEEKPAETLEAITCFLRQTPLLSPQLDPADLQGAGRIE